MKRLFLLIAVAGLAFAACENDDDYTDNGGGGGNSGIDDDNVINKRGYIKFKDPLVEEVCVRNFDLNSDGKLSYQEAARVEIIRSNSWDRSFFEEYTKQITSFDELQYFVNLKEIGYYAFADCTNLTSITLPEGLQTIEYYAFSTCNNLTSVTLPEGLQTIGYMAFAYCRSLTSITLPEGLQTIGDEAFYSCDNLTSITIPESVTEIGDNPFESCLKLQEFKGKYSADGGRALIKDNTFIAFAYACGTTEYTIPNNVTIIGDDAFYDCRSLTSITLPEGLQTIGGAAFFSCDNLTTITIPASVTEIGSQAFDYSGIKELYCKSTTPPIVVSDSNLFQYSGVAGRTIYVPRASVETYKSAEGWSEYASAIVGYNF